MKLTSGIKIFTLGMCSMLSTHQALAAGDDIDIFTGSSGGTANNPRVLIILDNSSNWSRQAQKWLPKGTSQGEAEARAISAVISKMDDSVSVGLMELVTGGPGDGGFIRSAIKPMNATNKAAFNQTLKTIETNINGPLEKSGSNIGYGNLMYDAYNYLTSGNSTTPGSVDLPRSDNAGYKTDPTVFQTPMTAANSCGKTFIIFIGNSGKLNADKPDNTAALDALDPGRTPVIKVPAFNTTTLTTTETVGITSACYGSATLAATALLAEPFLTECGYYTNGCKIGAPAAKTPACTLGSAYAVTGTDVTDTNVPNGLLVDQPGFNSDDWAKFMSEKGIPVEGTTIRPTVTTYTIDVYKAQGDAQFTGVMMSMANQGKGKYFLATSEESIVDALESISAEIQAVNSAFASTSLPVNATNRSQNQNQVFIGMFRPDGDRRPRWFGNLKRYQLILSGGNVTLGGADKKAAVNFNTGFLAPCALSYWSTDSGEYWNIPVGVLPPFGEPVKGNCLKTTGNNYSLYSDIPDGELVEKGAAAQMLRQGNLATAPSTSRVLNRNMKTLAASGFVNFSTTVAPGSGLNAGLVNWIRGADVLNEKHVTPAPSASAAAALTRPSIHGDVIHSRPQPVTYDASNVVIYYGANDGALHAVDAATGVEKWAFVEPDASARLSRLRDNAPPVSYAGETAAHALLSKPKDYYFDGSIGLYQNSASASTKLAWIYPAMRRGGRRVYAIDVSDKDVPAFKWKLGCDDAGTCDSGMSDMGQSWSTPSPAFIKGFSDGVSPAPTLIFGGGYDTCEDTNARISTQCAAAKGKTIYIRNANNGEAIASFSPTVPATERSFAADIAMTDIDNDGYVDYAYAADTGGGLWRINFINNPTAKTALTPANWKMVKIASMPASAGRKFLFAPSLLYTSKKVYIAIGTGDREHPLEIQYPYSSSVQNRFYVFRDDLTVATPAVQNLDDLPDASAATCSTVGAIPTSTAKGWYRDLNNGRGEQTVTSALIVGGRVAFSTNRPEPAAVGTCSTNLGRAYGYWFNLFTGSGAISETNTCGGASSVEFIGGGLPPTPVLAVGVPITIDGEPPSGQPPTGPKDPKIVTVCFGCAPFSGPATPVNPVSVGPKLIPKRKRSYTYSSTD